MDLIALTLEAYLAGTLCLLPTQWERRYIPCPSAQALQAMQMEAAADKGKKVCVIERLILKTRVSADAPSEYCTEYKRVRPASEKEQ